MKKINPLDKQPECTKQLKPLNPATTKRLQTPTTEDPLLLSALGPQQVGGIYEKLAYLGFHQPRAVTSRHMCLMLRQLRCTCNYAVISKS